MNRQWQIPRMQFGRKAMTVGEGGADPFIEVPHWQARFLLRALRRHRIEYRIAAGCARAIGAEDPDEYLDRISFPTGDAARIVALLQTLHPGSC